MLQIHLVSSLMSWAEHPTYACHPVFVMQVANLLKQYAAGLSTCTVVVDM